MPPIFMTFYISILFIGYSIDSLVHEIVINSENMRIIQDKTAIKDTFWVKEAKDLIYINKILKIYF